MHLKRKILSVPVFQDFRYSVDSVITRIVSKTNFKTIITITYFRRGPKSPGLLTLGKVGELLLSTL